MTIPVRNLTTAEEVFANARRLRDVFFHPRQIALAQVKAASEKAASDAAVTQEEADRFQAAAIRTPRQIANGVVQRIALEYSTGVEDIMRPRSMGQARKAAIAAVAEALPGWTKTRVALFFSCDLATVNAALRMKEVLA